MNKLIPIYVFLLFFACTACGRLVQSSGGVQTESFLELISSKKYVDEVVVNVDETISFRAKVNSIKKSAKGKSDIYVLPVGSHLLKISANGKVIFQKQIFVSDQETKQIRL